MNSSAIRPSPAAVLSPGCRAFPRALLLALALPGAAQGQQFTDIGAGLPVFFDNAEAAWADIDNDGDLDLAVLGPTDGNSSTYTSRILRNEAGTFTDTGTALPPIKYGMLAWADYDHDGDMDLAIGGSAGTTVWQQHAELWRNDGGSFTNVAQAFPSIAISSLAWGDYDNDGDPDLLLAGYSNTSGSSMDILRNNAGASFTPVQAGLPSNSNFGPGAWGDYDNDGDLDLACFSDPGGRVIRRNDNGNLSTVVLSTSPNYYSSTFWGDYDGDGDLDLGYGYPRSSQGSPYSGITRNDGAGGFSASGVEFYEIDSRNPPWGDFDNDGDLDFLQVRHNPTVAWNNGTGGYALDASGFGLLFWMTTHATGDYDGDGDLDILLLGHKEYLGGVNDVGYTKILRNDAPVPNALPGAPTGLAAGTANGITIFSWQAVSDDTTPAATLTYNVRVGTTPGGSEITSAQSDLATGRRLLPAMGNAQLGLNYRLDHLANGTYYWSVQAVDNGFRGGAFSAEHAYTTVIPPDALTGPASYTAYDRATLTGTVNPRGLEATWHFEWGSTAAYGNTTPVQPLPAGTAPVNISAPIGVLTPDITFYYRLVSDSTAGTTYGAEGTIRTELFSKTAATLPSTSYSDVAWGDYDNDGDLDLLFSGSNNFQTHFTYLWRNEAGVFVSTYPGFNGASGGDLAWGDFDRDGDLDMAVSGYTDTGIVMQIRRNQAGSFADIGAGLLPSRSAEFGWGDFDQDGDLDFAYGGEAGVDRPAEIRRNDGSGLFSNIGAGLPELSNSALVWGDYDNDGDADLILAGGSYPVITQIRRNDGGGIFTDINAGLPGIIACDLAWGDYDSDGDLDLVLAGKAQDGPVTQLRRNEGGGVFNIVHSGLPALEGATVGWGDYDNDGDLDLAIAGSPLAQAQIHRNDGNGVFTGIAAITPVSAYEDLAWGDYDNDGDLDLALAMSSRTGGAVQLWRNNLPVPNNTPSAPAGLTLVMNGGVLTFSWQAASDDTTPAAALTYNLRAGTTPGGSDVVSPHADATTGFRLLPGMGNAQLGLNFTLRNPPNGPIYWSVQAVDNGFRGGAFAPEQSFLASTPPVVVTGTASNITLTTATLSGTVDTAGLPAIYYFEFGRTTAYGSSTAESPVPAGGNAISVTAPVVSLLPATTYHCRLVARSAAGTSYGADRTFTTTLFTKVTTSFPGLNGSDLAWGDYDNDGDLDLVLAGAMGSSPYTRFTQVWRNNGGSSFSDASTGLPGLNTGDLAWGDYDRDGDLDLALTGETNDGGGLNDRVTQIRRNNGAGVLTDIAASLPGLGYFAAVAWGDYDNDGDPDLAVAGFESVSSSYVTQLRRNDGGGVFTNIATSLPELCECALAWADYDNDGDLDLALTGRTATGRVTQVRRNDGGGVFTDIGAGLPGLTSAMLAWGDYDSDGDLDLVLSGYDGSTPLTELRRNDGGGNFNQIATGLPALTRAAFAWGDYDNDGDPDLAISGARQSSLLTQIRRNDGGGTFTDTGVVLTNTAAGDLAWGDYNNDGDLDLVLIGGDSGSVGTSELWRNESSTPNTAPTAPTGPTAGISGGVVTLSWQPASDAQTPAAALTYNVRAGTTPGGSNIVSPQSNPATGFRRVPEMGNGQHGLTFRLQNLPSGTIYWSVQAVDAGFRGGAFAAESTFVVSVPPVAVTGAGGSFIQNSATLSGSVNPRGLAGTYYFEWGLTTTYGNTTPVEALAAGNVPVNVSAVISGLAPATSYHFRLVANTAAGTAYGADAVFTTLLFSHSGISLPGLTDSAMAWGDYDSDDDLDFIVAGAASDGTPITQLRRNEGGGVFTGFAAGLPGLTDGAFAWGDYDHDGDLDLALAGHNGAARIAQIRRNDGGGIFTDSGEVLPGVDACALVWGDYDNDGDLDLALAGNTGTSRVTQIYRNDSGFFTAIAAGLTGVSGGALAWGDFDNDGDLDLALAGNTGASLVTQIHRNLGGGAFVFIAAGLPGVDGAALAWGDYDSDGDLDLALAGTTGTAGIAQIRRNTSGVFTDIAAGLPGVNQAALTWGDYDHDGDLDLALAGETGTAFITQIRRNSGGVFTDIANGLPGVSRGALAWADDDRDGDLDLTISGNSGASGLTQVWRNRSAGANAAPTVPTGLTASVPVGNLLLSWQAASDAETPAAALTYNLRVGTTPGGSDIVAPQSNTANGFRRLPGMGNGQLGLTLRLENLPNGIYYWSVQAVDPGFRAGAFAPEQSSLLAVPPAVVTSAAVNVTGTAATLTGSVNPRGQAGTFQFEWGTSLAYGNTTPAQPLPAGNFPANVSAGITGLTPFTAYYFRVVATTTAGTSRGAAGTFTAAPFTDMAAGLPGLIFPALAWGDYDRDGDLDLAIAGALDYSGTRQLTQIRRNNGGNSFTDINAGLPGLYYGTLAWGDYDNDGDLDLALAGSDGANRIARIMRNDAGAFHDIGAGLPGIQSGALAWGDYDEDGDLDLIMSGNSSTGPLTRLRRNDSGGVFTNIATTLPDLMNSALAWADYDHDGDPDLVLAGSNGAISVTQLRRNDGGGVFTAIATTLPAVFSGALAWGDYDNDGDADLAIAGHTGAARVTQIRRNTGGTFTDIAAGLPGLELGALAWGDYDNDGDPDLALSGYDGAGVVTQLRRNDSGTFTDIPSGLPKAVRGALAWGDCDHDGDLDLALAGDTADFGIVTLLKRNEMPTPNLSPSAPAGLAVSLAGTTATFSWLAASDARTPAAALTYNLRVGTAPGSSNILGPQSNAASGFRLLPAAGNAQFGLNHKLRSLPNGIYYWSVQAVDSAFQGGPFASNAVFAAGSTLSASQLWRFQYFGTVDNTGPAADLADPEGDGLVNLLEFATGAHPLGFTPPIGQLEMIGSSLKFTYPRPKSALSDVRYDVEASATLSGTWSSIPGTVTSDNGITQVIQATTPAGSENRFMRLRVTRL